MNTICIIPAYNENSVKLQYFVNIAKKYVDRVVVIDDGSDDKLDLRNCILLKNNENKGKGYSIRKGFDYTIKNNYDVVITMDGDGEHDPREIPVLLKGLKHKKGLVIGTRKKHRSFIRTILNFWTNFWANQITSIKDVSCGFRAIDIKSLKKLSLKSNKFEIDLELILECYKQNIKITSLPVKSNKYGKSKVYFKDYVEINNFFDKWVLENINYVELNFFKRLFLLISVRIGLCIGNLMVMNNFFRS